MPSWANVELAVAHGGEMPFSTVADPQKLALLGRVLDTFCIQRGIMDATAREDVAFQLLRIFQRGVEDEIGLLTTLELVYRLQAASPTSTKVRRGSLSSRLERTSEEQCRWRSRLGGTVGPE